MDKSTQAPSYYMEDLIQRIPPYELSMFVNSMHCLLHMAKKHPHVYMYMLHKQFGSMDRMLKDAGFTEGLPPPCQMVKRQDLRK